MNLGILGVVLVASLALALLLASALQRAVTRPIIAVTDVARQVIDRRDFSPRVAKTTHDEVGYLVDAFNAMLAEVGRRADALEASNATLSRESAERREAEEALRVADRRKDEFLAMLAHELRNPLAPLRNALEILKRGDGNSPMAAEARRMMERQLKQMVRLVDDLLDVSRITTGKLALKPAVCELRDIIRSAVDTARALIDARGHTLTLVVPDEPLYVSADATRLAQVFSNLLNNAANYTEPGGRIELRSFADDKRVTVSVIDNGIGIAPAPVPSPAPDRNPAAPSGVRRVLIADDNVDFAMSLEAILKSIGHDVRVTHDGLSALDIAASFVPDIAFVDIGLPGRNGYDVARSLRQMPQTATCALVAVTGWGQNEDRRRSQEAGFSVHLVKPVDPQQVIDIVAATIARAAA